MGWSARGEGDENKGAYGTTLMGVSNRIWVEGGATKDRRGVAPGCAVSHGWE